MICQTFRRLAFDTWDKIRAGKQVHKQLKEETLTDLNLLDLKTRHGRQIRIKEFSKPQEGKNGADWEWWFLDRQGQWIGFRVQAKIINIDRDEYEHLHYRKKASSQYQCDKLILNSMTGRHPKIPIYCLYSYWENNAVPNHWTCGTYPMIRDLYGCSLISAFTIRQLRQLNRKHLQDLYRQLRPWHCLVCCSGFGNGQWTSNIESYAKNSFDLQQNDNDNDKLDIDIPENFVTKEPPNYVVNIFENEFSEDIEPPDKDIDGVLIIEQGQEKE